MRNGDPRHGAVGPGETRTDAVLLAAHAGGDATAFPELVARYRERLWALAVRTLLDPDDAADALQEGLLSAFRAAAGYRGDASVSTWLHRIVLNACLDRMRRRRARPADPLEGFDRPTARDPIADHLTRLTVEQALAALPVAQRVAVVLVDMQGFSVLEAADLLGTREGTVKSRCHRARNRLAVLLGHLRPEVPAPRTGPPGNATGAADVQSRRGPRSRDGRTTDEGPGEDA